MLCGFPSDFLTDYPNRLLKEKKNRDGCKKGAQYDIGKDFLQNS